MQKKTAYLLASTLPALLGMAVPATAQIPNRSLPASAPAPARPAPQAQAPQQAPATPAQDVSVSNGKDQLAPAGYKLGVDDVFDANVLGQSDFHTRARVRPDGTATLPYLGNVPVVGETSVSLADKLAALLKAGGYYAKPIVSVEIVGFVSNYITVLGSVGSSGLMPVDRVYHLSEVIARSGGIRGDAAEYVVLTRKDGTQSKLEFKKLAQGGPDDDPLVTPGDKVFVPEAELYYIYGAINSPGKFPIRSDLTLQRAIASSGGLTAAGSFKRVKVTRDGKEIKLKMSDLIKPGDTIVIGERLF